MKAQFAFVLCLLLTPSSLAAANWAHTWGGSGTDYAYTVAVDASGNVYAAGSTSSFGAGGQDVIILKYSSEGALLWAKTWGGSNNDFAYSIALGPDGYLYVVGTTSSFGAGATDIFLLKLTLDGNLIWGETWGGGSSEGGDDLGFDSQGNIYIAGESYSFGNSVVLLKFSPSGGPPIWTASWKGPAAYDSGYSLAVDPAGNIVVAGVSWDLNVHPRHDSILVLKFDGNGKYLWSENWLSPNQGEDESFGSLTTDAQGNIYVGGRHSTTCPSDDFSQCDFDSLILKLDPSGKFQWARSWGGPAWDTAGNLAVDANNHLLASDLENAFGQSPTLSILSYDTDGNLLKATGWSTQTSGPMVINTGITVDNRGTIYLANVAPNSDGTWKPISRPTGVLPNEIVTRAYSLGTPVGQISSLVNSLQLQTGGITNTGAGGGDVFVAKISPPGPLTVTLSPSSLTFGNELVSETSSPQFVTLQNSGNSPLAIFSILATQEFAVSSPGTGCSTRTPLAAGASCTIAVRFMPSEMGTRTGTLMVSDDSTDSPQSVDLTGTGIAPVVGLSSLGLTFAPQAVGVNSPPQSLTLSNTGTGRLVIGSISISHDFAQTNTCHAVLEVGTNCTITMTFTPKEAGSRTGTLTIVDSAHPFLQTVSLIGTALLPNVRLFPLSGSTLTFSKQLVGTTSAAHTINLLNWGAVPLVISRIGISGDFVQTNGCGQSVPAGTRCAIQVAFTPKASGTRTGVLRITDNASAFPQSLQLSGLGVAPALSLSPPAGSTLTFSSQSVGSKSKGRLIYVRSGGTAPLAIFGIAITGDFCQTNTCGESVAGGTTCTIEVNFSPQDAGDRSGTLTITNNVTSSPQVFLLTGKGN